MKQFLNQFIIKIISFLPVFIIRLVAGRYVAGENSEDALKTVTILNKKGFTATLDILGEHTKNENIAHNITRQYQNLLSSIHDENLDCNISIKLSHIGMDLNKEFIYNNINSLIDTAKNNSQFIRIDMEHSALTDATIDLYLKCKDQYDQIGIVLQAYLHRSKNDLIKLQHIDGINVRICKGIYKENANIAIMGKKNINSNFLDLLRFSFENDIYVGIATHDISLIKRSYNLINDLNISNDRFEFQVLYGVPMSGWLEKHLKYGYKVRVYVPFGKDWYDYSIRRLKENPNISFYILRDVFRR